MATPATSSQSNHADEGLSTPPPVHDMAPQDPDIAILFPIIKFLEAIAIPTPTPTPWSNILKAWVKDLPADPFNPFANVPIFDETACSGNFSSAYYPQNFIYNETPGNFLYKDTSGDYAADIHIFTRKVAIGVGTFEGSRAREWNYSIGIHAKLTMRHGIEAEIFGAEDTTTIHHPLMSGRKGQDEKDPSWKDVVSALQSVVFKDHEAQPSQAQSIQTATQVPQHVQRSIQIPNPISKPRLTAVPNQAHLSQLQPPRNFSATTTTPTSLSASALVATPRTQQSVASYTSPYLSTTVSRPPSTTPIASAATPSSTQQRNPSAATIAQYHAMLRRISTASAAPATPTKQVAESQLYTPPPTNATARTYQTPQQTNQRAATATPGSTRAPVPSQFPAPGTNGSNTNQMPQAKIAPTEATIELHKNFIHNKRIGEQAAPVTPTKSKTMTASQLYTPPPTAKDPARTLPTSKTFNVAPCTYQTPQQQFYRTVSPPTSMQQHTPPTGPSAGTIPFYEKSEHKRRIAQSAALARPTLTQRGPAGARPTFTKEGPPDGPMRGPNLGTLSAPTAQGSIYAGVKPSGNAYFEKLMRESQMLKRQRQGDDGQGGKRARIL